MPQVVAREALVYKRGQKVDGLLFPYCSGLPLRKVGFARTPYELSAHKKTHHIRKNWSEAR